MRYLLVNRYRLFAVMALLSVACNQRTSAEYPIKASIEEAPVPTEQKDKDAPRTYAVIAAVADYKVGNKNDVRFTVNGARKLYERMCGPGGAGVPKNQVRYVVNEQASRANILQQLDYLFSFARPQDRVVFYFSGHGLPGALVPYDVNPNAPTLDQAGVLMNSDLKRAFEKCKAKTKLVLVEACHSGSLSQAQRKALARHQVTERGKSLGEDLNIMVLMSSRANEMSLEIPALKQGLFSYYLNEALRGAADKNQNRIVTARELFDYVSREVTNYAKKLNHPQHPRAFGRFSDDMPVISV